MPRIDKWVLQAFPVGDINSQKIDFSIDDHDFVMIFTPVLESGDVQYLKERSADIGFSIPQNSYDVKFDRIENFQTGNLYAKPSLRYSRMNFSKMSRLGHGIAKILDFHRETTNAEVYLATAEHTALKSYYDRLAKQHASRLKFNVTSELGSEGLDYAIKTENYKY